MTDVVQPRVPFRADPGVPRRRLACSWARRPVTGVLACRWTIVRPYPATSEAMRDDGEQPPPVLLLAA